MRSDKINDGFFKGLRARKRLRTPSAEQVPQVITSPQGARANKLNELRAKIQSGAYQIDFDKLAQKILDKEISS